MTTVPSALPMSLTKKEARRLRGKLGKAEHALRQLDAILSEAPDAPLDGLDLMTRLSEVRGYVSQVHSEITHRTAQANQGRPAATTSEAS